MIRLAAEIVLLASLFLAGHRLPTALAERRLARSDRLSDSPSDALRRAGRWRWLTAPLGVLLGLLFIGLTL